MSASGCPLLKKVLEPLIEVSTAPAAGAAPRASAPNNEFHISKSLEMLVYTMHESITEQHLINVKDKYFHYQPVHVSPNYTHLRLRWMHYVVPDTTTFDGAKNAFIKIYGCQDRGYYNNTDYDYMTFTYCFPLHRGQNLIHHPQEESWIKLHRDFNLQNLKIEIFVQSDTDSSRPVAEELMNGNAINLLIEFKQ